MSFIMETAGKRQHIHFYWLSDYAATVRNAIKLFQPVIYN
jgi:hypothetical protein